ncbi:MAG TPA: putative glycoside hydrolase [Acidimicrobiia bacterium]|nr:putative glycoside hydrolase [Acidimicrobiia bacterium]
MAKRTHQLRVLLVVTLLWAGWAAFAAFGPEASASVTVVDERGAPIEGAVVTLDGKQLAVSGPDGTAVFSWPSDRVPQVVAAGFLSQPVTGPTVDSATRVRLIPHTLRGVVRDPDGRPVAGVYVESGRGTAVSARDGSFMVRLAEPGDVRVWRPAWHLADFEWDGGLGERTIVIEPRIVKAVHVTGEVAGDPTRWNAMLDLKSTTELNGVMLDLKDEYGLIYYDSKVGIAEEARAVHPLYDLAQIVRDVDEHDLYLIGRIVTFQDPLAAHRIPDMAAWDTATGGPYGKAGQWFLDPTDTRARGYALSLAVEACQLGVDEIQFDYVRYPDGLPDSVVFDGGRDPETRVTAIESFLLEAREVLHPLGCAVAGDIFGFITTARDDGGIGQQWEIVADALDVVSPMLYPSHYSTGWYGFDRPVEHPGEMVRRALQDGIGRLERGAVVRPWLQDFGYNAEQVRAQIDSAHEFGLGWMLWNALSNVTVDALDPR